MAWARRIKLFPGPQIKRGKGLEEFIEKRHPIADMVKPPDLSLRRKMETSFWYQVEKTHIRHIPHTEEAPYRLGAQAFSSHARTALPAPIKTTPMSTNIQRKKEPAKASEPASTQPPLEKRSELNILENIEELADRVYRLMQRQLISDRERARK